MSSCQRQVFATALAADGSPRSTAVLLSDDPNRCRDIDISWDGSGWTAVWELWRNLRYQVFWGRMVCD